MKSLPILAALVLGVGLAISQSSAQTVLVQDDFDDGDLAANPNGVGSGNVLFGRSGKTVVELVGGPAVWESDGGTWHGLEVHSRDEIDFLAAGGVTTYSWTVGNITVTGPISGNDYRMQFGVLPAKTALQGTIQDLWWQVGGGVFLNMEFDIDNPTNVNIEVYMPEAPKAPASWPVWRGGATVSWDWVNELATISIDVHGGGIVVRHNDFEVASVPWGDSNITIGPGGEYEDGAWGMFYASNRDSGVGGHELHNFTVTHTPGGETCDNGVDDDGDGDVDCADGDCVVSGSCVELECGNGVDDDNDGRIDCADRDCATAAACNESVCGDGLDNDGDGMIDCADPNCFDDALCIESACDNGLDDDGDGVIDCEDSDCSEQIHCILADPFATLIVNDSFDDGDLLVNVNGVGNGYTTVGSAKTVTERFGAPAVWESDGGTWAGVEIHSLDTYLLADTNEPTRITWTIGNVVITNDADGTDYLIRLGVRPATHARGVWPESSGDMWWSQGAGLFMILAFNATIPNQATLEVYVTNKDKVSESWSTWRGGGTLDWDWGNELTTFSAEMNLEQIVIKREGEEIAAIPWADTGVIIGPDGEFAQGAWAYHMGQNNNTGQGGHELHSLTVLNRGGNVAVLTDHFADGNLTSNPTWQLGTGEFGTEVWLTFDDAAAPDGDGNVAGLSPGIDRPNDSWIEAGFRGVDPSLRILNAELQLSVDRADGGEDNALDIILLDGSNPVAWSRIRPGGTATVGVGGTLMAPLTRGGGIALTPPNGNVPMAYVTSETNVVDLPDDFSYRHFELVFDHAAQRVELFQAGTSILALDLTAVPGGPLGFQQNLAAFAPTEVDALRIWTRSRGVDDGVFIDAVIVGSSPQPLIVDCDGPNAPQLMAVAGGLGATADSFISPLGEDAPLTDFEIEVSHGVTLAGSTIEVTGGTAPTAVALAAGGAGPNGGVLHTVQLTGAAPAGQWTKLTLDVVSDAGCEGTLTVFVAHQPLDINQDGDSNIRDATAFGDEFRAGQSLLLVDINNDGVVNVRDATAFGNNWNGVAPATQAWRNTGLPAQP